MPARWFDLRRSVAAMDEELAAAEDALENQPGNQALQRVVACLTHERNNLQALLASVTSAARQ